MNRRSICCRHFWKSLICFFLVLGLVQPVTAAASGEKKEVIGGEDSGVINVLLVGQDRREETRARSDSVILCSFRPEDKQVIITSFLRDLYVEIPGYDANRLNAAYVFGGMPLLEQTLRENFDVAVDGCVEVDFSSFPQLIDLLGGVTLELRQDEADTINASVPGNLSEGSNLLNGSQALAYSRIRNLDRDGDFSRTNRQRKLLSSLLDRYREANLLTILSVVADVLPMINTDMSKKQILLLAAKLFPMLDDPSITSQRIPAEGSYTFERVRGMDVLLADMEENKEILCDTILPPKERNK